MRGHVVKCHNGQLQHAAYIDCPALGRRGVDHLLRYLAVPFGRTVNRSAVSFDAGRVVRVLQRYRHLVRVVGIIIVVGDVVVVEPEAVGRAVLAGEGIVTLGGYRTFRCGRGGCSRTPFEAVARLQSGHMHV